MDEQGKEWFSEKDKGSVAEKYFMTMFASEDIGVNMAGLDQWANDFGYLTIQHNDDLLAPITKEEVRHAMFDINPNKSPGLDGINGHLFQQFWDKMGDNLTEMVRDFFQNARINGKMNRTSICLFSKKRNAIRLSEFRLISLSNVSYKVIAKILAQRLKSVLPYIISETQAAFVERRLISDNILIAHELLHALKSKNKCAEEFVAVKTDISKAFDRVEWRFLVTTMEVLGFSEGWIELIMACVTSVTYKVLINGKPNGHIKPTRGIR